MKFYNFTKNFCGTFLSEQFYQKFSAIKQSNLIILLTFFLTEIKKHFEADCDDAVVIVCLDHLVPYQLEPHLISRQKTWNENKLHSARTVSGQYLQMITVLLKYTAIGVLMLKKKTFF